MITNISKIHIEASTHCNYTCSFCSNTDARVQRARMSPRDFTIIMDNIAGSVVLPDTLGLSQKGEPFTNPQLHELISLAKQQYGFEYVYLSTNGYLCTQDRLDAVIEAGLDSIKVSFNALECEQYAQIHGVDGYDQVVENITSMLRAKREGSPIKIFLSMVLAEDKATAMSRLQEIFGSNADLFDATWIYPILFSPAHETVSDVKSFNYSPCDAIFSEVSVDANGELTACCKDYFGELRFGNLLKEPFSSCWNSKEFNQLRELHTTRSLPCDHICFRCLHFENNVTKPHDN